MYDFTFLVVGDADIQRGLGAVREMFRTYFGGQKGVRIKGLSVSQVETPAKLFGQAPAKHYLFIAIVDSDSKIEANKPAGGDDLSPAGGLSPGNNLRPAS